MATYVHLYCCTGCGRLHTEAEIESMGKSLDDDPSSCDYCEEDE